MMKAELWGGPLDGQLMITDGGDKIIVDYVMVDGTEQVFYRKTDKTKKGYVIYIHVPLEGIK